MNKKIRIGIIGGAGYTGGELLRILLGHPQADIVFVHSKSQAGKPIADTHQDLIGDTDLIFSDAIYEDLEVLFLCVGHGEARVFLNEQKIPDQVRIIDLSQDFRNEPDFAGRHFIYGLPETFKGAISKAKNIANPGCFATAIQLALAPLAQAGHLLHPVHISGITGSTGAGQQLSTTSHYSWRHSNVSTYKVFNHQHLQEVNRTLSTLDQDFSQPIHFVPYRGAFTRGIWITAYTHFDGAAGEILEAFNNFYKDAPFTIVTDRHPNLKQVINTNKALVYLEKHGDQLVVTCVIDNLVKGASGQAVQNMNLMMGLEEKTGLALKPVGF